jgi:DNA-binding protein HU-beta
MQKTDLVKAIAEKSGLTQKESALALNATLDAITAALAGGDKVTLTGFGTFEVRARAARSGINPQTREKIEIAAMKAAGFKAGAELVKAIKE